MSDEEKIQIAALGLLGLFSRRPKSKTAKPDDESSSETKEDPGVFSVSDDESSSETKEDPGVFSESDDESSSESDNPENELQDEPSQGSGTPEQSSSESDEEPSQGSGTPEQSSSESDEESSSESDEEDQRRDEDEQRRDEEDQRRDEEKTREGIQKARNIEQTKPQDIIQAIQTLFDQIDKNEDGKISKGEFIKSIRSDQIVQNIFLINRVKQEDGTRDKMEEIFQGIDKYPEDRKWSREEFLIYMFDKDQSAMLNRVKTALRSTRNVFDTFDENKNGVITSTELVPAYEINGKSREEAEQIVEESLREFDKDGDGALNPSEFQLWTLSTNPVWLVSMMQDALLRDSELRIQDMRDTTLRDITRRVQAVQGDIVQAVQDDEGKAQKDKFKKVLDDLMIEVKKVKEEKQSEISQVLDELKTKVEVNVFMSDIIDQVEQIVNKDNFRKVLDDLMMEVKRVQEKKQSEVLQVVDGLITELERNEQKEIISEVSSLVNDVLDQVEQLEKKSKKKKRSRKKSNPVTNKKAKERAIEIMNEAGVRIASNDGKSVAFIVNQDNAETWEEIIKDIENIGSRQAYPYLFQAIMKGMFKDKRTTKSSRINLASLQGKVLKPGGYKRYIEDIEGSTTKGKGLQVNQYNISIVKKIIEDLKNGENYFNEYKPKSSGAKQKPKAKPRRFDSLLGSADKPRVPRPRVPSLPPTVARSSPTPSDKWAGISKAAEVRIKKAGYDSIEAFLSSMSKESDFDLIKSSSDINKVATFLGKLRGKNISGKQGIVAELKLKTRRAEAEEKESELEELRERTVNEVRKRFKNLNKDAQFRPRNWREYAELYAKEEGFTTDNIPAAAKQAMAALWVEKHKNDNDRTGGLYIDNDLNHCPPQEPRLRF